MRRKVSQAFLNGSHRKKFENTELYHRVLYIIFQVFSWDTGIELKFLAFIKIHKIDILLATHTKNVSFYKTHLGTGRKLAGVESLKR